MDQYATDAARDHAAVVPGSVPSFSIAFLDGERGDKDLLSEHIFRPVQESFQPDTPWMDAPRTAHREPGSLAVSLFPNVPGDVLLMFDLADRNHFRQFSREGRAYVRDFRKIVVPGTWLRRRLLADHDLRLAEADVLALGAPRIDYLRRLAAARPTKPADAPLTILFAPVHGHWFDGNGDPMSVQEAMTPFLAALGKRYDLRQATDGRNKQDKVPVTGDLLDADIVITDYTSLMYEAWALGKPVIFPNWLCAERILEKAPSCAEAHVYRERIGHHAANFQDLLTLLRRGRGLDLGPGVEEFMADYLSNWKGQAAAPAIARLLEAMINPENEILESEARAALQKAVEERAWDDAEALATELLSRNPQEAGLYDTLARALNGKRLRWQECEALERAIALAPTDARLHYRLGEARARLGHYRAAAAALADGIRLEPKKRVTAERYYALGFAYEAPASDGHPNVKAAADAYALACQASPASPAATLGIGVLHAAEGRWPEARDAYRAQLAKRPLDAELLYRLGMAHDRCYEWEEAEAAYVVALGLSPDKPAWHHRLGFVRERLGKHAAAAQAYLHAARSSKTHKAGWYYRAGCTLEKAGDLEGACAAFMAMQETPPATASPHASEMLAGARDYVRRRLDRSPDEAALWVSYSAMLEVEGDLRGALDAITEAALRMDNPSAAVVKKKTELEAHPRERRLIEKRLRHNCSRPKEWARYSELLEGDGEIDAAIHAMEQAVLRSNDHVASWHRRLGQLLMKAGNLDAACAAFRDQRIIQRAHGAYEQKFQTSEELKEVATYREFFDVLPIVPNTILYESFGGEGCSDNPLAIFNQVQRDPRFKGWRHFWVVDDMSKAAPGLLGRSDVFFVVKETVLYQRLLCTVEFLVNNATFPSYYVRKEGQEYLSTWHGTPLKTLGCDIVATPLQRANTARNLIQASMFIAPNAHTEHIMLDRYAVRNLFTGRSLLTGYPRIDSLVNADDDEKARIRKLLGLDPDKPVVLFAPTYRGHWATPELEAQSLVDTLERMKSPDYNLVFRGHYFAESFIMKMDLPVTIAPHSIDSCSLLSVVDVLVTDYSSIFYDFLITRRPVIHFVPDWDYYVETRGVYFGKDQLPGIVCETEEHLLDVLGDCIRDPKAQISAQYLADQERYCALEDGKASERVVEAFFFQRPPPSQPVLPDGAKHILVYGGDLDSGPQLDGLRGLLAATRAAGHVNTVIVDRRVMINSEERTANGQALLDHGDVIIRFGKACFSLEEAWINDQIKIPGYRASPAMQEVFEASLRHEVRRLFGQTRFDSVLNFDGERAFWANLLSTVPAKRRQIMVSGELFARISRGENGLERVAVKLPAFDRVLSPTPELAAAIRQGLKQAGLSAAGEGLLAPCVDKKSVLQRAGDARPGPVELLIGLPGHDTDQARRMIDLLARAVGAGRDMHLLLATAPGTRAFVQLHAVEKRVHLRVASLDAGTDLVPQIAAASAVLIAPGMDFGMEIAAIAGTLGRPWTWMPASAELDGLSLLAAESRDPTDAARAVAVVTGGPMP